MVRTARLSRRVKGHGPRCRLWGSPLGKWRRGRFAFGERRVHMPETASQKGSQKLLLINDLPGYGKVALAAMEPVLSHMGYECFNLPTMLVSNTLDY